MRLTFESHVSEERFWSEAIEYSTGRKLTALTGILQNKVFNINTVFLIHKSKPIHILLIFNQLKTDFDITHKNYAV